LLEIERHQRFQLINVGGRKSVERRGDIVARVSAPFKCPKETVLPF